MSTINGASHYNVEDILASIRGTVTDDTAAPRFGGTTLQAHQPRREAPAADEAAEFELPAIFKPGYQPMPDKPNLFGRLSDALKSPQTAEPERSRTVIRFEPAAAGRMIEPPAPLRMAQTASAFPPVHSAPQPEPEEEPVKREMPSFFDTRLNRLGEMTRKANAPVPVEPKPAPPVAVAPPLLQQPPLLPESTALAVQHNANMGVEDAAAQLLRPMLRQWLTENMPKIVEKALRSEAGSDGPSAGPAPEVRKTLR
jgi:cell pole-organizing protein PopZ